MKGIRKLALDTALLTGAALVMRCIGLAYQVWLAGRIGASGIGLWQLIVTVSILSATLAVSGIRFTATRLISEELGRGSGGNVCAAVSRCLVYAAAFGCAAFLLLFLGAEPIGFLWIRDARTVASLRIIAFTLPLISLSSVLNGYFIAVGSAWKSAVVQVAEQLVNVACVMWLLGRAQSGDIAQNCAAIARGNLIADAVSLLLVAALYLPDRLHRAHREGACAFPITGRMLRIALPLAFSAYARTGLSTLENLLVPRKLRVSGLSADRALSGYGTITGMVFPVIGFPSCLLSALAELSVPELTAAQVCGSGGRIRKTVAGLLQLTLLYSLAVAAVLFFCADTLGELIYRSRGVGAYIRTFAFLVPVMYMDIVTDGCLKGLGQMMRSMEYNIAEACIGVALVVFLLPRAALDGYVFVIYFCEIFNFTLSFSRLIRVVRGPACGARSVSPEP